ncbi:MAG: hypothetical protein ABI925_05405, partial [Verrucomicrobiota bacterium]
KTRIQEAAPLQSRRYSYVDRGLYAGPMERVFQFFPREQIMVIKSEEFRDQNSETLDSIFKFLGVSAIALPRNKDRNVVPYERAITAEERERLRPVFSSDIEKLEQMLGWNCADWKR